MDGLLREIDGLTLDASELADPPFAGSITLSIGTYSDRDRAVVARNKPYLVWDNFTPIRVRSEWPEPAAIAEFNKKRGIRYDRSVVARTCSNIAEEIVSKVLVLMTCYLPGSSRCHFVYSRTDLVPDTLDCLSNFDDSAKILMKSGLSPTPSVSFRDFLKWSRGIQGSGRVFQQKTSVEI